jgi:hypothetical protein
MRATTTIAAFLVGLVLLAGVAVTPASAQNIPPVSTSPPFTPVASPPFTIVLSQQNWLPVPEQPVTINVFVGATPTSATIELVCPDGSLTTTACPTPAAPFNPITANLLRTSAYPGICTNYPSSSASNEVDFSVVPVVVGAIQAATLTPHDCGGMAVVKVTVSGQTPQFFILPQDSDFDGMPDLWEAQFCTQGNKTCVDKQADADPGVTGAPIGDGIGAFDEYRGFRVSGNYIRTRPDQKDLFVQLRNPQCTDTAPSGATSLLGGGAVTFPTDGTALFGYANTLILSSPVRILCYIAGAANPLNGTCDEWVDNLVSYSEATGFNPPTLPASDRQINVNALYPIGPIQRGLRVMECLDSPVPTPSQLGSSGIGSPNGPDNSIVYTQRIVAKVDELIAAGAGRALKYSTFVNGGWTTPVATTREILISKMIQWAIAHEIGHSVFLTPTVQGTKRTSYGYHFAPYSGDMLDQTITTKIDTALPPTGFNTFYIPSAFGSTDQTSFKLK